MFDHPNENVGPSEQQTVLLLREDPDAVTPGVNDATVASYRAGEPLAVIGRGASGSTSGPGTEKSERCGIPLTHSGPTGNVTMITNASHESRGVARELISVSHPKKDTRDPRPD